MDSGVKAENLVVRAPPVAGPSRSFDLVLWKWRYRSNGPRACAGIGGLPDRTD